MTAANLRLLPTDQDFSNIESRMTSVSLKDGDKKLAAGASLTTVLSQALQAEDTEQLDWIISQRDQPMIEQTLSQMKEPKAISQFFSLVVHKFQAEKSTED